MDEKYLNVLLKEAKKAQSKDEVPISALIVNDKGKIIAKAHNNREKTHLTINHAEIICINKANKCMKNKLLDNCSLYITLEPCDMCKVVIKEARIKNVYYLLNRNPDKKLHSKTSFKLINNHLAEKDNYQQLLANFFKKRR